jgi:hypothetical protein
MVRVAVPAAEPAMLTELVEPKLRVGRYCAPEGVEPMAAVSTTFPVKPPTGVTVIVDVFPVVAPGETFTARPVIEKEELTAVVTDTRAEPLAEL